jgi:hypothetical protein
MVQRAAFQRAQRGAFRLDQWIGAVLPAGIGLHHALHRPAFQQQAGGHQQARRGDGVGAVQPPGQAAAGADRGPGAIGHRPAVAGTDEAAFAEKRVGGGVRGAARGGFDGFQQFDGAGEACGGGQGRACPVCGKPQGSMGAG